MQISGYGAVQQAQSLNRTEQTRQARSSGFSQAIGTEFQKDTVSISQEGRSAQAGVLSASEKSFFNDSFGMNVFGAESAKGPVVSNQAASVLDSQEINYFQNTFGGNSQASSGYTRSGYGQSMQPQSGMSLNMRA